MEERRKVDKDKSERKKERRKDKSGGEKESK